MSVDERLREVLDGQTDELDFEDETEQANITMTDPADQVVTRDELEVVVVDALDGYLAGFEDRLASSIQKALDMVVHEYAERIRALEEDQARILRHLGLESNDET